MKGKEVRFYSSVKTNSLNNYSSGLNVLTELKEEKKKGSKVKNIYKRFILNFDLFLIAYEKISKNQKTVNSGIYKKALAGSSYKVIEDILTKLKNHRFQFQPLRPDYSPHVNAKLKPLDIFSLQNQIVEQVMYFALEAVYEDGIFLNSSHGFRKNRSPHTGLKQVSQWTAVKWFIKGDIEFYFDTINHQILANLLQKRIQDQEFLDLYWKAVKAGYVGTQKNKKVGGFIEKPQGSIIFPILANIYLHELDVLMKKKIKEDLQSKPTSQSYNTYLKIYNKIHSLYE